MSDNAANSSSSKNMFRSTALVERVRFTQRTSAAGSPSPPKGFPFASGGSGAGGVGGKPNTTMQSAVPHRITPIIATNNNNNNSNKLHRPPLFGATRTVTMISNHDDDTPQDFVGSNPQLEATSPGPHPSASCVTFASPRSVDHVRPNNSGGTLVLSGSAEDERDPYSQYETRVATLLSRVKQNPVGFATHVTHTFGKVFDAKDLGGGTTGAVGGVHVTLHNSDVVIKALNARLVQLNAKRQHLMEELTPSAPTPAVATAAATGTAAVAATATTSTATTKGAKGKQQQVDAAASEHNAELAAARDASLRRELAQVEQQVHRDECLLADITDFLVPVRECVAWLRREATASESTGSHSESTRSLHNHPPLPFIGGRFGNATLKARGMIAGTTLRVVSTMGVGLHYTRGLSMMARDLASMLAPRVDTPTHDEVTSVCKNIKYGVAVEPVAALVLRGVYSTTESIAPLLVSNEASRSAVFSKNYNAIGVGWQAHDRDGAVLVVLLAHGFQESAQVQTCRLPMTDVKRTVDAQPAASEPKREISFHRGTVFAVVPQQHPIEASDEGRCELSVQCAATLTLYPTLSTEASPHLVDVAVGHTVYSERVGAFTNISVQLPKPGGSSMSYYLHVFSRTTSNEDEQTYVHEGAVVLTWNDDNNNNNKNKNNKQKNLFMMSNNNLVAPIAPEISYFPSFHTAFVDLRCRLITPLTQHLPVGVPIDVTLVIPVLTDRTLHAERCRSVLEVFATQTKKILSRIEEVKSEIERLCCKSTKTSRRPSASHHHHHASPLAPNNNSGGIRKRGNSSMRLLDTTTDGSNHHHPHHHGVLLDSSHNSTILTATAGGADSGALAVLEAELLHLQDALAAHRRRTTSMEASLRDYEACSRPRTGPLSVQLFLGRTRVVPLQCRSGAPWEEYTTTILLPRSSGSSVGIGMNGGRVNLIVDGICVLSWGVKY
eukprot:PhM_4_TR3014/c3_g1_i3/m.89423